MKRFRVIVQHEIFIYSPTEEIAKKVAVNAYAKTKVVSIKEVALPEDEIRQPIIDKRTAPGS
jgi:hypothetical protein